MKSASLTASGSGQQRQKRSIPDDESGLQVEDTPETQEAVDGHCEKAMSIASVEGLLARVSQSVALSCDLSLNPKRVAFLWLHAAPLYGGAREG